jgi:phosphoglycerate dehydrogenase-like enzyme
MADIIKPLEQHRVWIRIPDLPRPWVDDLEGTFGGVEFRHGNDDQADPAWTSGVDIIFTSMTFPDSLFEQLPSLRWVQFTRGSVFELVEPALRESAVPVSVIRSIDRGQFSEFVMGCILLWAKKFPQFFKAQEKRSWERMMPLEISGMTVGILGLGAIGTECAKKAKAFGMRIVAIKRKMVAKPAFVDELWTPERLPDFLSEADFLVISLPSSPEVDGLLGLDDFRLMKHTAYLINVTADRVIPESVLVKVLKERWIAGAVLDAFPRQPLPSDSELWDLDNVIITPRIGGFTPNRWKRLIPVFKNNLERYLSGQEIDVIDKRIGY